MILTPYQMVKEVANVDKIMSSIKLPTNANPVFILIEDPSRMDKVGADAKLILDWGMEYAQDAHD